MRMSDSDKNPKLTLEQLLQLKRAECPDTEFWGRFERELRQKQLSALLERKPWWQELPQLVVRRAYLPVGAAAVLAFTLVSVKYYAPANVAVASDVQTGPSVRPSRVAEVERSPVETAPVSSQLVNRADSTAAIRKADVSPAVRNRNVDLDTDELLPVMLSPPEAETPSARTIAANLARLEQSEPELLNALGSRLSSPVQVQTTSAAVSDLASIPTVSSRRVRLLARYDDRTLSPEPTAPENVRERIARRLADSDLNDRLTRLGVQGDRVSLKF
jgi:hypothetical protein